MTEKFRQLSSGKNTPLCSGSAVSAARFAYRKTCTVVRGAGSTGVARGATAGLNRTVGTIGVTQAAAIGLRTPDAIARKPDPGYFEGHFIVGEGSDCFFV